MVCWTPDDFSFFQRQPKTHKVWAYDINSLLLVWMSINNTLQYTSFIVRNKGTVDGYLVIIRQYITLSNA